MNSITKLINYDNDLANKKRIIKIKINKKN